MFKINLAWFVKQYPQGVAPFNNKNMLILQKPLFNEKNKGVLPKTSVASIIAPF